VSGTGAAPTALRARPGSGSDTVAASSIAVMAADGRSWNARDGDRDGLAVVHGAQVVEALLMPSHATTSDRASAGQRLR
jgi:hypothetical protein